MASPSREAIDTFINITGVSEAVAVQKLEAHGGDLNQAVDAHFNEGDRNITHETPVAAPELDAMDIDDDPIEVGPLRPPLSLLSSGRNPFLTLDPDFRRGVFDRGTDSISRPPFVSHPREVREVPIEVKDGNGDIDHSSNAPIIEEITGTEHEHVPEICGTVVIDDEDDQDIPAAISSHSTRQTESGDNARQTNPRPSAPAINDLTDYSNDIEEEMVRAAIEASKRDTEIHDLNAEFNVQNEGSDSIPQRRESHLDAELEHAVSLSLKTAEQEKASRELTVKVGVLEPDAHKLDEGEEPGILAPSNGRLELGSSSVQDEAEDVEEQPLVRNRSRQISSSFADAAKETAESEASPSSSPQQRNNVDHPQHNEGNFPSDEWGGISSEEHDEAVMLEAALFGGIPEGSGYHFPYAPHQFMQGGVGGTMGPYPRPVPRPPSPSLTAQRLIREQQDDEYLASLQADREKELKAMEEAEARRLEEQAAREAALAEQKRNEEESRRKAEEDQEIERQIAAKGASLPQEPPLGDENAVTILVRMPDGNRQGRRFLKFDKLQCLFDFIDIGRGAKPGTYRLVRPYPRRAFNEGESGLTLNELGLTSKQEALFLELI